MLPGHALVVEQQCLGQFSITEFELFVFVIFGTPVWARARPFTDLVKRQHG
jgi:hypothetical protein